MVRCNLCGEQRLIPLLDFGKHPIAHHFLNDSCKEEYIHPVILCFCEGCGHIQLINPAPPEMFYANYVCLSSWKYQPHIPRCVQMIEELPRIDKTSFILEVGSNDGSFLYELQKHGYQNLLGIEPARDAQEAARKKGVKIIPSYFNLKAAKDYVRKYGRCDLFIARQVLEHISDLKTFKDAMNTVLSPDGFVIFEVPNFACNLKTLDYTIWEEHINYFTPETLSFFLAKAGIQIIHSETTLFSGETLMVIGENVGTSIQPSSGYINSLRTKTINYCDKWPVFRDEFIKYLREYKEKGGKMAVYGAGARACSLINFVGLKPYIEFIVDDQPEKQVLFMPGSKLPILPSDALEKQAISLCLLGVNTECEDKVISKHTEFVERGGTFESVLPPSNRLPSFWKQLIKGANSCASKKSQ